jgi:hypothetical protein
MIAAAQAASSAATPAWGSIDIPRPLLQSALMRQGGYGVYAGLPDSASCARLYQEAAERYPTATAQESWDDDLADGRGGKPRRRLLTAEAGPVQDQLYAAPWLAETLSTVCGITIAPSGNRGSYSYYARPGDFLDLHRDVETCDLAMITCLYETSPGDDPGGALTLYPGRIHEPLSAIRARPDDGALLVKLQPGQTILLFGGVVPHLVVPVREGQVRVISVLCFEARCGC